ncbi:unnamed protein product, partial [Rotaria sp. Silwood1]
MNDDLMFGGLWLPKLSVTTLSDALVYIENGEYLRYLPERTRLIIDMSESDFFVQNTQEPIVRRNEIIFHTVLFSMLCLGLFGLLFLVVKLLIVPIVKFIQERYFAGGMGSSDNGEDYDIIDKVVEEE